MALFPKGDPAKKLASEIEALRRELDNVVARRKSDDASLPGLADAVSRLLREAAPDRDLEAAEAKLNAVEKRIVVCTKTEVEVQEQIAAKEKELAAIHDARLREQTDVQIEEVKKSVEIDGADFQRAADKYADDAGEGRQHRSRRPWSASFSHVRCRRDASSDGRWFCRS